MARSLIGALIRSGANARSIAVAEPEAGLREALARDFGVAVHAGNTDATRNADTIVLAVKPQVMRDVCGGIGTALGDARPLIVSIAAGIRLDQIEAWIGRGVPIVRAMPNTPALDRRRRDRADRECAYQRRRTRARASDARRGGTYGMDRARRADGHGDRVVGLGAGVFLPARRSARRCGRRTRPVARNRTHAREPDLPRRRPHARRERRSTVDAARTRDVAGRHDGRRACGVRCGRIAQARGDGRRRRDRTRPRIVLSAT